MSITWLPWASQTTDDVERSRLWYLDVADADRRNRGDFRTLKFLSLGVEPATRFSPLSVVQYLRLPPRFCLADYRNWVVRWQSPQALRHRPGGPPHGFTRPEPLPAPVADVIESVFAASMPPKNSASDPTDAWSYGRLFPVEVIVDMTRDFVPGFGEFVEDVASLLEADRLLKETNL